MNRRGSSGGPLDGLPAPGLVLLAIASTQLGASFARGLFDDLGPAGTVFLRVAFAALVLGWVSRPALRGHSSEGLRTVVMFGVALAAMNLFFYEAIDRIPLGVAVALEFVGPLGVAVAGSRTRLDALWVLMAALGIVLLASRESGGFAAAGAAFALLAGACWAAYILLSVRAGRDFPGATGLALAMAFGAVLLVPVGVAGAGTALLRPGLIAAGAGVAVLSSALPYTLELEALRRIPARVFGILLSLEPAFAAVAGWVVLGQDLSTIDVLAIALVGGASAGASLTAAARAPVA